jgi:hypothetical protein
VEHLKKFITTLAGLTHENLHNLEEFTGYTMIHPSEYWDLVYKVRPLIYAALLLQSSLLLLADQIVNNSMLKFVTRHSIIRPTN